MVEIYLTERRKRNNSISLQLAGVLSCRLISTHHITKNIELISQDNNVTCGNNFQLSTPNERPLLVILSWLLSKRKHIMKFTNFYMEQGFDVVTVSISPWQLIWPVKGSRVSIIANKWCY